MTRVYGMSQDVIMEALRETGGGCLPDIADHFDISEATARRKLDGLVYQGQLRVTPGRKRTGPPRFYEPVETA